MVFDVRWSTGALREFPPGAAPGVTQRGAGIDRLGRFSRGVTARRGCDSGATAVGQRRDKGTRWRRATAVLGYNSMRPWGVAKGLRGLAKGGCETSQGVSAAIFY